ncbi:hypothetical protein E3J62_04145 [candidate division TA06 bacterium]|uniref:Uncharacterized protein n=1 Tax=candidate division TA06 bacterium TaxID=2250710 RepID=A0A523UVB5_UNCT6|nr:MAG: hypothetical protein E3J62_04145 [candidate division TA06 bacterium]
MISRKIVTGLLIWFIVEGLLVHGAQAVSWGAISLRTGLATQIGVFTSFKIRDTEGKEWRGFDGYPLVAMSGFGEIQWNRISGYGWVSVNWLSPYFGKNLSTPTADQVITRGGHSPKGIGLSYSFVVAPGLEVRPRLGYTWTTLVGRLELRDKQTGEVRREVGHQEWDENIHIGVNARLWQDIDNPWNIEGCPKLQVEYRYASVLGGTHTATASFKLSERAGVGFFKENQAVKIVAQFVASPSVKSISAGLGADGW